MPLPDWNQRYTDGEVPWDTADPDDDLIAVMRAHSIRATQALVVGCGTGTNAAWLAEQGANVVGVDVSEVAVTAAVAKLEGRAVSCRFAAMDFLKDDVPFGGPFDFVFDRGCFHLFDDAGVRANFAARVAHHLVPGGLWLTIMGSTEGPERDHGPPRRTVRQVVEAIEPSLEIVALRASTYHANIASPATSWVCLSRRRRMDAQPSTTF